MGVFFFFFFIFLVMRGRCAISIKILVDEEDFISKKTLETSTDNGCVCIGASDVKATVELVSTAAAVIFIVFDLNTPKKTGSDLIKAVKSKEGTKDKFYCNVTTRHS